jgi:ATP-dependent Lon protease
MNGNNDLVSVETTPKTNETKTHEPYEDSNLGKNPEINSRVIQITSREEWNEIMKSDSLVVVCWSANRCTPCIKIAPKYSQLSNNYHEHVFVKVDVEEMKKLAKSHKVKALPTFDYFYNNEHIRRIRGARISPIKGFIESFERSNYANDENKVNKANDENEVNKANDENEVNEKNDENEVNKENDENEVNEKNNENEVNEGNDENNENNENEKVIEEVKPTKKRLRDFVENSKIKLRKTFSKKEKEEEEEEEDDSGDSDFIVDDDDILMLDENPLEGWKDDLDMKNEEDKRVMLEHEPLLKKLQSYLPKFMKVLKSHLSNEDKEELIWKVAVLNNSIFDAEYVDTMLNMQKKIEYYDNMNEEDIQKYKVLEEKFKDVEFEKPMKNRIFDLDMDDKHKKIVYRHYLQNSLYVDDNTRKNDKEKKWLETVMSIPWGINSEIDIPNPTEIMAKWDKEVSGLFPAKEEFILTLTDYITNPTINPKILTLKGVPGCGKTLFVQSVAKILNLPVQWIDLAGMNEVNFLKGFAKTWDGSKVGRLVESIINMQSFRGIIVLEEIDKVNAGTRRGKETLDSLVPILDRTRNHAYYDNYLSDIPVPLNNILFIATCNDDKGFPDYLLDRLNVMEIESPDMEEKLNRAHNYIIPAALSERKFNLGDVIFPDDSIKYIIEKYTLKESGKPEEGVRTLKERLQSIIQRVNYFDKCDTKTQLTVGKGDENKSSLGMPKEFALPFTVTRDVIDEFLKFQKPKVEKLSYFM